MGTARSSVQEGPDPQDDDALRLAPIRLAKTQLRFGHRKIGELLQAEAWRIDHRKVERLSREEGLQRPERHEERSCAFRSISELNRAGFAGGSHS